MKTILVALAVTVGALVALAIPAAAEQIVTGPYDVVTTVQDEGIPCGSLGVI